MRNRALFISSMAFEDKAQTGGIQCSKRNYRSVSQIFGEKDCVHYNLQAFSLNMKLIDKIRKFISSLKGYANGSSEIIDEWIISLIYKESISYVFVDSSLNGKLIQQIKRINPSIKIVAFFHNCEYSLVKQDFFSGNLIALIRLYACYLNEKLTCQYADKVIALNERDANMIKKCFGRVPDVQIPISLFDICDTKKLVLSKRESSSAIELLFIGSNFYPNVHGIKWFIKNVLPKVDVKLTIIGRDLKNVISDTSSKITILSNVVDLSYYYYNADVVIAPIFKGSGMKVKIAEAMMYGKPIIGTSEAFQGYLMTEDMLLANNVQEFVNAINSIQRLKYSQAIRELYVNHYSFGATLTMFKTAFGL